MPGGYSDGGGFVAREQLRLHLHEVDAEPTGSERTHEPAEGGVGRALAARRIETQAGEPGSAPGGVRVRDADAQTGDGVAADGLRERARLGVRHELEPDIVGGETEDDAVLLDAIAEALERLPAEAVERGFGAVEVARVDDDVESGHGGEH